MNTYIGFERSETKCCQEHDIGGGSTICVLSLTDRHFHFSLSLHRMLQLDLPTTRKQCGGGTVNICTLLRVTAVINCPPV